MKMDTPCYKESEKENEKLLVRYCFKSSALPTTTYFMSIVFSSFTNW